MTGLLPAGDPDLARTPNSARQSWWRLLPVLLPLGWFLFTGISGIDFGVHWDEHRQRPVLQHMRDEGTLLPGNYWYGSVIHWLGAASAGPELLRDWGAVSAGEESDTSFGAFLESDTFRFRRRVVFLVLAGLAIVWVYMAALSYCGSALLALVAASFLGLSWEFGYHARWPLPDAVTTQFAALTLLGLLLATSRRSTGWLMFAAMGAGLATGTKYPAGMLLVPVLVAAWILARERSGLAARARLFGASLTVFAATYLVTTPGTLLEPTRFWQDVSLMVNWYGELGHGAYTVDPGLTHARLSAEYVALVLLSRWPIAAALSTAFAAIGVLALYRARPALMLMLLSFPLLHIVYMSTQKAMIVRNLLPVAPFIAFFAALGIASLWAGLRGWFPRGALVVLVTVPMLANGVWLGVAADSVAHRSDEARFLRELAAYANERPGLVFSISPRVATDLQTFEIEVPDNIATEADGDQAPDRFVLYASDVGDFHSLPANRRGLTEARFGPHEVNFDYYPSWWGHDRILVFSAERAAELGLDDPARGSVDELRLFNQAWMLQKIGEDDGAIGRYRRFLRERPDHVQAWFNMAYAQMETARYAEAVSSFERCLELAPGFDDVHAHLGRCYEELGQAERARQERDIYRRSKE